MLHALTKLFSSKRTSRPSSPRRLSPAPRRTTLGLEALEDRTVPTVVFNPALGAETVSWLGGGNPPGQQGNTRDFAGNPVITSPLATNPTALNSPKIYLVFLGPAWVGANGQPVPSVNTMVNEARTILSSSYLSGLEDYGSDGRATFGGMTVDPSGRFIQPNVNPIWLETQSILSNSTYASWRPPVGTSALNSPIYCVVRLGNGGGSNSYGPNQYINLAVNGVDITTGSVEDIDNFGRVFSHEIAERMSDGVGGGIKVISPLAPNQYGQVSDAEPDSNYYYRLNGSVYVSPYWSITDQAFIVPDGTQQKVVRQPLWNGNSFTGQFVSLQQGNLYQISGAGQRLIDTQVSAYAIDSVGHVFDLTASGQVKEYSGSGTNWTAVTGGNTHATRLVTANGGPYMLASNGGPNQVWRYSGSGTNWNPVTGTNTTVSGLGGANGGLYMLASNGSEPNQVWQYTGSGWNWMPVTGTNTNVSQIAADGNRLFMLASNGSEPNQVWQHTGSGNIWITVTGTNTNVATIVAANGGLYMMARNDSGFNQVWQYDGLPNAWTALTGTNTNVFGITLDGTGLYMRASNNGGPLQYWRYAGTPSQWTVVW